MAALDYLRRAGLTVEAVADKLRVSPLERITPELRGFIVEHKAGLLAELGAGTNQPAPARPALRLVERTSPQAAADAPPAPAAPAPTPTPAPAAGCAAEVAGEPQRIVRTAVTASPAWLAARDQYLSHAMTCLACHAPTGRYCPTGAELRATYDTTPMELTP